MNEQLIYKLADAFQTDMCHVGNDVRGLIQGHVFSLGPWVVKSDITIIVDENSPTMVSALVRVLGNLWGYFMATSEGTWLLFFDGSRVKLHVGAEHEFGLGSANTSLKKLKPAITRVFHMASPPLGKANQNTWEPMPLSVTDDL